FRLDDTGGYSFAVWTPNRNPPPVPIAFGQSLLGQEAIQGDIVGYCLKVGPVQVGTPVSIVLSSEFNFQGFRARLELLAPDGTLQIGRASGRDWVYAAELDDFVLQEDGAYTLRCHNAGYNLTGAFSLGVSYQPVPSRN